MAEIVLNKSRPEGDFMILFRMCGGGKLRYKCLVA